MDVAEISSQAFESISRSYENKKWELTHKRWATSNIALTMVRLRAAKRMTQKEAARRAGISLSAFRSYEQMKAVPRGEHLIGIAKALEVEPEALCYYVFAGVGVLENALFQLSDTYGLMPASYKEFAALVPCNDFMSTALSQWAYHYKLYSNGKIDKEKYQHWKDTYKDSFDMTLFPIRYKAAENTWESIEPWQNICFAKTIKRLREQDRYGWTQAELGAAVGVPETTVRSWEQAKRLPKHETLLDIANAFEVTEGALTFTDFGSPVGAIHTLFQIAGEYSLIPELYKDDSNNPILRTRTSSLEAFLDIWAVKNEEHLSTKDDHAYQTWRDTYGFGPSGHTSRYRTEFKEVGRSESGGALSKPVVVSDYDQYDPRFRDTGYLKA